MSQRTPAQETLQHPERVGNASRPSSPANLLQAGSGKAEVPHRPIRSVAALHVLRKAPLVIGDCPLVSLYIGVEKCRSVVHHVNFVSRSAAIASIM